MIASLNGRIIEKRDTIVVLDVQGVGYELYCPASIVALLGDLGTPCRFHVHTNYSNNGGFSLYGFMSSCEKALFLSLIKVDSVGPKSALNIMSGAPWDELVHLIEDGDVAALSKLPKISKKTAEHLVVKLKGKLGDLLIMAQEALENTESREVAAIEGVAKESSAKKDGFLRGGGAQIAGLRLKEIRKLKSEAQTALSHLGFKPHDVERALDELDESAWNGDLQSVIRLALTDLAGNV